MKRITTHDASEYIERLEEFGTHGSLRGAKMDGFVYSGRMPSEWAARLHDDAHRIDYVVTSYATPIAWHLVTGEWIVPDTKYSVTTSKHQGQLWRIRNAMVQS